MHICVGCISVLLWFIYNSISTVLVVEGDVVHAEVRLQALEGAVGRVHGAAAAVAAQGHGVGDHRVHPRRAARELKSPVEVVLVCTHVLVHFAHGDLQNRVLGGAVSAADGGLHCVTLGAALFLQRHSLVYELTVR